MIRNVIKTPFFIHQDCTRDSKNRFICYMKLTIDLSTVCHHRQHAQGLLYPTDAFDEQAALA